MHALFFKSTCIYFPSVIILIGESLIEFFSQLDTRYMVIYLYSFPCSGQSISRNISMDANLEQVHLNQLEMLMCLLVTVLCCHAISFEMTYFANVHKFSRRR